MVAFNFQREFAPHIISGWKTSTLRPKGKRRLPFVGEQLQLFTGMRTPHCVRLMHVPCSGIAPFEIHHDHVFADGFRWVTPDCLADFARIEGFTSFGNLQAWFDRRYGLPVLDLTQIKWNPSKATQRATSADLAGLAV